MKSNVKKVWAITLTSLFAYSSIAHAAYGNDNKQNLPAQTSQKTAANAKNERVINPPARPILKNGTGFYIDGELLWWKARETGLDFATKAQSPQWQAPAGTSTPFNNNAGQISSTYTGNVKNPHFHWEFGVRAGLGFNLPFDGWDIALAWTHLNSHAHRNATFANPIYGERILPEFQSVTLPDQFVTYTYAKPDWRLRFNTIDLDLGREFFVSRHLTIRPFVGLRAAWVHQRYHVYANGATGAGQLPIIFTDSKGNATSTNVLALNNTINMKNDFNGLGPRLGFDTEWRLGCGFSIYGQAAIALLLGHFTVDYDATTNATFTNTIGTATTPLGTTVPTKTTVTDHNSFHDARAATDLALGIRWAYRFADDTFRLRLDLGWEQHLFFSQNQFISFENQITPVLPGTTNNVPLVSNIKSNTSRRGDLSLSGLTFAIRFDF